MFSCKQKQTHSQPLASRQEPPVGGKHVSSKGSWITGTRSRKTSEVIRDVKSTTQNQREGTLSVCHRHILSPSHSTKTKAQWPFPLPCPHMHPLWHRASGTAGARHPFARHKRTFNCKIKSSQTDNFSTGQGKHRTCSAPNSSLIGEDTGSDTIF